MKRSYRNELIVSVRWVTDRERHVDCVRASPSESMFPGFRRGRSGSEPGKSRRRRRIRLPRSHGSSATGNRLLDLVPPGELDLLLSAARIVELRRKREIFEQGGPMPYVYFPTTGVVSLVIRMEEGNQVEAATVGNEGMIGTACLLGLDFSLFHLIAQVPGQAYRVPARSFAEVVESRGALDRIARRYLAYRLRQASQTIACNALHSVEERMCRWLLMAHDRAGSDEFLLTHELLAEMLGIRRQSVTVTAGIFQRAGLISYRRGVVRIEDRGGLEEASCECYGVARWLYDRLLG
jgi:CRP-like cAMP-binding protein